MGEEAMEAEEATCWLPSRGGKLVLSHFGIITDLFHLPEKQLAMHQPYVIACSTLCIYRRQYLRQKML